MATQKAISGQPERNDGGAVLNGGNVSSRMTQNLTLADNAVHGESGPNSSVAWLQAGISGGVFHNDETTKYIGKFLTEEIAGVANTAERKPSNDGIQRPINATTGYHRIDFVGMDENDAPVYGSNKGDRVLPSGISGGASIKADHAAFPTQSIPGELVYMTGSPNPTQSDYKNKTAW